LGRNSASRVAAAKNRRVGSGLGPHRRSARFSRAHHAFRRLMADQTKNGSNTGKIVEIKSVVLDAVFPAKLPAIYSALKIDVPSEDGEVRELIAEVQQHLGDDRVRAVAMDTTDGLSRGVDVVDTGKPISVPVGNETLGRVWNVIGEPV